MLCDSVQVIVLDIQYKILNIISVLQWIVGSWISAGITKFVSMLVLAFSWKARCPHVQRAASMAVDS